MFKLFQTFEKAAIVAAFFILGNYFGPSAYASTTLPNTTRTPKGHSKQAIQKLEVAKKKITSLLLLKQRAQALEIIQEIETSENSTELAFEISKLKLVVLTSFLTLETQDYFELASSQYLNQIKISQKNTQKCLAVDPEQFQCLWADIKSTSKSSSHYQFLTEKIKNMSEGVPELRPLTISLDKTLPVFKSFRIDENFKSDLFDANILATILEFDRSLLAKNYLLAKESLEKLRLIAPDYIDITIMQAQLYRQTFGNELTVNLKDIINIYKKKCEAVPAEISRKYFYDIDFCRRTM